MGCNCKSVAKVATDPAVSVEQAAIDARRVMCLVCPARRGRAWAQDGQTLGHCKAAGVSVGLTIAGVRACPKGRHPDADGVVRSMGVRWLGVPMPIRWVAAALGQDRGGIESVDALPGCGCIAWLKQKASAISHWASVG